MHFCLPKSKAVEESLARGRRLRLEPFARPGGTQSEQLGYNIEYNSGLPIMDEVDFDLWPEDEPWRWSFI